MSEVESQFLEVLRTATGKDLSVLARLLAPYIAETQLRELKVWGDRGRLNIDKITIPLNDLLINTRSGHVAIGEDCFFGHRCMLLTGTHDYSKTGMQRLTSVPDDGRDIVLERGGWLGSDVTVLGPARIGENAVVAAGSLVTGDVPANTIVAGRPAKPVKKIDGSPC